MTTLHLHLSLWNTKLKLYFTAVTTRKSVYLRYYVQKNSVVNNSRNVIQNERNVIAGAGKIESSMLASSIALRKRKSLLGFNSSLPVVCNGTESVRGKGIGQYDWVGRVHSNKTGELGCSSTFHYINRPKWCNNEIFA